MIVCSKRVFLNVLTQFLDANTLLNANYYIADQTTRNGIAQMSDNISINGDGEYTIKTDSGVVGQLKLTPYHIHYGNDAMSPISLMSKLMLEQTGMDIEQMFKNQLMTKDNVRDIYNFLYSDKSKGNGLRILIYVNDTCVPYMYIVCEYISQMFGEDITFIDKQYRNDIRGQVQYAGNKENAVRVLNEIKDYIVIKDIIDLASNYQYGYSGDNNLTVYFDTFDIPQLFKIYELLFPTEPLTPGNYTKDHIIHIIVEKLKFNFPKKFDFDNLLIPSFADMSELYTGISDDELMSIHE
jgi:hypothetical protein